MLSRQTCAKQGTFLAEATRGNCTLDLQQSWLGVLRPQQHLPEEAPRFLFTTDGFELYEWAAKRLLQGICIYGQVIKKRRENRVVQVDRRLLLGTQAELEEALFYSEDSSTLNTW